MKVVPTLSLLVFSSLVAPLLLSSCASKPGSPGDGSYVAPPTLSPADATDQMRSKYREWVR
jgi:hypothetical protein